MSPLDHTPNEIVQKPSSDFDLSDISIIAKNIVHARTVFRALTLRSGIRNIAEDSVELPSLMAAARELERRDNIILSVNVNGPIGYRLNEFEEKLLITKNGLVYSKDRLRSLLVPEPPQQLDHFPPNRIPLKTAIDWVLDGYTVDIFKRRFDDAVDRFKNLVTDAQNYRTLLWDETNPTLHHYDLMHPVPSCTDVPEEVTLSHNEAIEVPLLGNSGAVLSILPRVLAKASREGVAQAKVAAAAYMDNLDPKLIVAVGDEKDVHSNILWSAMDKSTWHNVVWKGGGVVTISSDRQILNIKGFSGTLSSGIAYRFMPEVKEAVSNWFDKALLSVKED